MQSHTNHDGLQGNINLDALQRLRNGELTADALGANIFDPFFDKSCHGHRAMMSTHAGQVPEVDGNEPRIEDENANT